MKKIIIITTITLKKIATITLLATTLKIIIKIATISMKKFERLLRLKGIKDILDQNHTVSDRLLSIMMTFNIATISLIEKVFTLTGSSFLHCPTFINNCEYHQREFMLGLRFFARTRASSSRSIVNSEEL